MHTQPLKEINYHMLQPHTQIYFTISTRERNSALACFVLFGQAKLIPIIIYCLKTTSSSLMWKLQHALVHRAGWTRWLLVVSHLHIIRKEKWSPSNRPGCLKNKLFSRYLHMHPRHFLRRSASTHLPRVGAGWGCGAGCRRALQSHQSHGCAAKGSGKPHRRSGPRYPVLRPPVTGLMHSEAH